MGSDATGTSNGRIGNLGHEAVGKPSGRCGRGWYQKRVQRDEFRGIGCPANVSVARRIKGDATLKEEIARSKIGGKWQCRAGGAYFRNETTERAKREGDSPARRQKANRISRMEIKVTLD